MATLDPNHPITYTVESGHGGKLKGAVKHEGQKRGKPLSELRWKPKEPK